MNETLRDVAGGLTPFRYNPLAGGLAPLRFHALAGGLTPFRYEEVAGSATGGLTEIAGWTLVHFLWQGLIIALLAAAGLACLRRFSAATRYLFACGGLALMLAAPVVTALWMLNGAEGLKLPATTSGSPPAPLAPEALAIQPLVAEPSGPSSANLPTVTPPMPELAQTGSDRKSDWLGALHGSLPVIVGVWCAGVVLLSLRLLAGLWRVWQWRGTGVPVQTESLKQMAARLALRMGVRQPFELLESARTHVPAVIGWLRPVVMVPGGLVTGLTPAELESLLAHELAHIRRHDYLVNLLQTVVETVLFYHPAVWWLSAVIRTEREHCCDDLAVAACGNRVVFARALARMEELRCGQPGLALSARGGSLLGRIQRIVLPQTTRPVVWWPAGVASLASLAAVAAGLWATLGTDPSSSDSPAAGSTTGVETAAETDSGDASADDDQLVTHRPESEVVDGKTGQTHRVLAGVKLLPVDGKASAADLKYSNLMPYTFIPERVARELNAVELGELDFGERPQPGQPEPFPIKLNDLVPPPPMPADEVAPREQAVEQPATTITVDELTEPAGARQIVPYTDSPIFVPDHLAFYGVNQTGQRRFRVVRIEKVDLGLGPSFGPVNALVLDDANSDLGVLGSNWARIPRGRKGESFVHSAVDGFWFIALNPKPADEADDRHVLQIIPLQHISAEAAERTLREKFPEAGFASKSSDPDFVSTAPIRIGHWPQTNSLFVSGTDENLKPVIKLVKELDVPGEFNVSSAREEKVLATHTYDMSRRESTGWVDVDGTQVPVDAGVEHGGVKVYVSLMFDVVAVNSETGKTLWSFQWNKGQPVWQTISILEVTNHGAPTLVVELVAGNGEKQRLDFSNGKPLEEAGPSEADHAPPVTVVQRDGERIAAAAIENPGNQRATVNLVQRFQPLFERSPHLQPGQWVTDEESLVSTDQVRYVLGDQALTGMDADSVVFSLPEGSEVRAEFTGNNVAIESAGEVTTVTITEGRVRLIDAGGVCRADASADGGADLLVVECRRAGEEYNLNMKTGWSRPELGSGVTPVQVKLYQATGAPADEEQPPHRAVRYRIEHDAATPGAPMAMKMSWHYDLSRLATEAEQESGKTVEELLHGVANNDDAPVQTFEPGPGKEKLPQHDGGLMPPAQMLENSDPVRGESGPAAEGEPEWGALAEFSGLQSRLVLQTAQPTVGQPLLFSLELRNAGDKPAEYDPQDYAPFRVLRDSRTDGKPAPFIGTTPQTSAQPVTLKPGESTVLWKDVDATELFVLMEGKHEFLAEGGEWAAQTLWRDSNTVEVELQPGRLSPFHSLVWSLTELELRPEDWSVSAGHGAIFLSHSPTNLKRDVTTIQLWFTDEPLPADFQLGEGPDRQDVTTIAPCELGHLHVAAPPRAKELWPEYVRDIRIAAARALNFNATPANEGQTGGKVNESVDEEVDARPWQAAGRVTDREGRPLAGVGVQAHCGFGTLFRTGQAVTDKEGRYDLRFGPGCHSENRQLVQAATISVSLEGHVEQNLHRQGDLVAALEKPEGDDLGWGGKTADDLFLPGQPKTIDFVMVPATKLSGVIMGKDGDRLDGVRVSLTGPDLPPSSSVVATTRTDKGGRFELTDLPTGFAYQLLIEPAKAGSPWLGWASPPLTLGIDEQGNNCFTTEHDGRKQFWTIQELFIQLDGEGLNWKEALASSTDKPVEMKFDGISTQDLSRISAGMATMVLGSGQE